MKAYYKHNLKSTYLILEGKQGSEEDYQIHMLKENKIAGVLDTDIRYVDEDSHYYYDISGKVSLKALHEKAKLTYEEIKQLVETLLQTIKTVHKYMLEANKLLLNPEYIFYEKGTFFFCYYPPCTDDAAKAFHELTEYFVREVDYQDERGVQLAYTIHKATMTDNYSLEKIMAEFKTEKEESEERILYREKIQESETEDNIIAEKKDFWAPVKSLIGRAKKERWDDWDDIYIEEEEL